MTDAPNHRYFRTVQGRWRCTFAFAITDRERFRAFGLGALNRIRVLSLLWVQKLLGPFVMETNVDYDTAGLRGEVRHTLRLIKWHVTVFSSEEILALDVNGHDVLLSGRQWLPPIGWIAQRFGLGRAHIEDDGRTAQYEFPWFGTTMRQSTHIDDDAHVSILQETEWSRGMQRLERQAT